MLASLASQCGIDVDCARTWPQRGRHSISGVQSIDSYFSSVLRFQTEADRLSAALNAELNAIGAVFGIEGDVAAGLEARIAASVEGGVRVHAGTPSCEAATDAVLHAEKLRCEGEAASDEVDCRGRCELPLDGELECGGEAELACTFLAAATPCEGECKGGCTTDEPTARDCSGVCRGTCSGACSLYSDTTATECAGRCDGTCTGSCEVELTPGCSL